jgi:UDPglucose 6-dehydrogenase
VRFLVDFGNRFQVDTPLFRGVLASNDQHKGWLQAKISQLLKGTLEPVVAVLGLTYKPGTSTLRRSTAVELCTQLHGQGVRVQAHDPAIRSLPDELRPMMRLCHTPLEALRGADLAVVATEWPDYRALGPDQFVEAMRRPRVIDPNHFLADLLAGDPRLTYIATGTAGSG